MSISCIIGSGTLTGGFMTWLLQVITLSPSGRQSNPPTLQEAYSTI
jgi:hypothetical protein